MGLFGKDKGIIIKGETVLASLKGDELIDTFIAKVEEMARE